MYTTFSPLFCLFVCFVFFARRLRFWWIFNNNIHLTFSAVSKDYLVDFMGNIDEMISMMEKELKQVVTAAS